MWLLEIIKLHLCGSRYISVVLVTQSCPTLCNPVDCSPPDFSVHGILLFLITLIGGQLQCCDDFCCTSVCIGHRYTRVPASWTPSHPIPPGCHGAPALGALRHTLNSHRLSALHIVTFVYVLVTQSCPTLCDPMDCSWPGSSVPGILQARTLEWLAIPFSRGSSQPRDQTWVSQIAGRVFMIWANREAQ